ncbi:MAG: hypothetical protein ABI988_18475 [Nitrospirota bacterium]
MSSWLALPFFIPLFISLAIGVRLTLGAPAFFDTNGLEVAIRHGLVVCV